MEYVLRYGSALEPYEKDGIRYVKVFILDADVLSKNRWGVTDEALLSGLRSFIGKPIIGPPGDPMQHGVDPKTGESLPLDQLSAYEDAHRVGTIIDVGVSNGIGWGIARITSDDAWAGIKSGAWMWVSPQIRVDTSNIQHLPGGGEMVESFIGRHVAFVDNPAFGGAARTKGTCVSPDVRTCNFSAAVASIVKEPTGPSAQALTTDLDMQVFSAELELMFAAPAGGPGSFPWDECMTKMMKQYGDEDTAKKVCAAIKNRSAATMVSLGLAKTMGEAATLIGRKMKEDPLYAYAWGKFLEASQANKSQTGTQTQMDANEQKEFDALKTGFGEMQTKMAAKCAEVDALSGKVKMLEDEKATREAADRLASVKHVVELKVACGLAKAADAQKELEAMKGFSADTLDALATTYQKLIDASPAGSGRTRSASVTFSAAAGDGKEATAVDALRESMFGPRTEAKQ